MTSMTPDKSTLSAQLREHVRRSGRTLTEVAREADVDLGNLSSFMHGKRGFSVEALDRLAAVLGVKLCRDRSGRRDKR